jgi:hypothetical protein
VSSCDLFGGPAKATKNFYYALDAGRIDEAMEIVSNRSKSALGEQKLRGVLSDIQKNQMVLTDFLAAFSYGPSSS